MRSGWGFKPIPNALRTPGEEEISYPLWPELLTLFLSGAILLVVSSMRFKKRLE